MKISNFLVLGFILVIMAGCSSKQKYDANKAIVGIWQNTTNPGAAIEFTKEGDYYLRMDGERLLTGDSIVEKYSYDPLSEENNLIIYGNSKMNATQAKLVIINPERIKISLVHQETIVSEAEFTKEKKQ